MTLKLAVTRSRPSVPYGANLFKNYGALWLCFHVLQKYTYLLIYTNYYLFNAVVEVVMFLLSCRSGSWSVADWHHIAYWLAERVLHADRCRHSRPCDQLLYLFHVWSQRSCRCGDVVGRYQWVPMPGHREATMLSADAVSLVLDFVCCGSHCSCACYHAWRLSATSPSVATHPAVSEIITWAVALND